MIHPTAIIDPEAEIDEDVEIGPYSIIRANVSIASGTWIGSHVTIDSYVDIGPDCQVYQYASIGAVPQAIRFKGEQTYLKIGRNTIIREFVTLNRGTEFGGGVTRIGEDNFLMAYTHVAHDCITGRGVIMANNATLAGHVIVGDHVTIGGLVAVHQFVRLGEYSYIGGKSAVVKDIPPYLIAAGDRANLHGLNKVGLQRHQFSEHCIAQLKKAYRIIFRIGLTVNEAVERVLAEVENTPEVLNLVDFIRNTQRGITR
ncbi:UDP-N-acetylglucosamine acyltransferase [Desulfosalsimonas propionicica]|jgi:UDP-N-acetylglucosamine acyltransferase|uniref:Acyl-[acyl-carrier-protein]--UDP-N-acetylglucosamine O-acyltransferase n=1 Tax=Desulfosalsimonas propionicica TaxID=332175 RepID=A0A7W0CBW6_9BACT|nr:acyl-ACP--UDP-N-acetylglucosamine O-acyltransferase [Desulfosalsimonas propionicica]MBA2882834.1 UDP-N-acetylglucosamine acyltransferase [Desulfosalsimonas propionicica]MCF8027348.1 acyl-ACP--UDP-N-acetylglucosamine O-acyltransferase [Desulfobacteraceae bacterium]